MAVFGISIPGVIGVIYILVGILLYKFFGKQLEEFYRAIVKPKQRQQVATSPNNVICSQCRLPIPKTLYLQHLKDVHQFDVLAFLENLKDKTTVASGVAG